MGVTKWGDKGKRRSAKRTSGMAMPNSKFRYLLVALGLGLFREINSQGKGKGLPTIREDQCHDARSGSEVFTTNVRRLTIGPGKFALCSIPKHQREYDGRESDPTVR